MQCLIRVPECTRVQEINEKIKAIEEIFAGVGTWTVFFTVLCAITTATKRERSLR